MSLSSSNFLNDQFSNLSVENVNPSIKKAITPLVSEYEINHGTTNSSVNNVLFNPFDNNSNLLIYQSSEDIGKLSIFSIDFTDNQLKSEFIEDIVVGSQVGEICWSPETDLQNKQGLIKLAVTLFNSNEIQVISTILESNSDETPDSAPELEVKRFSEQIIYRINSIEFEPLTGELLAATGDDSICYIFNTTTGDLYSMFKLTSPGMSVKFHIYEPNKLLVAEKKGIIRFYDVETKASILSFSCDTPLIQNADWCKTQPFLIGCTAGPNNVFYNTAQSSYPIDKIKAHTKNGEFFSFYDHNIYASRGKPNGQIIVQNKRTGQLLFEKELKSGTRLSWNLKYPILAVGAYNKIIIYHFAILS